MLTWDFIVKKNLRLNDPNLHPTVRQKAWDAVYEAWQQGIYVLITQGYRSIAEQDALYAQGRTKPGKIVTNAKGGTSYHNFGLAVDFALYTADGKDVTWDDSSAAWKTVVRIFKAKGFAWGGDFRSFKDTPHFEMTFGLTTAQLRAGKRPNNHATTVSIPKPETKVASVVDVKPKEADYMIPTKEADKIISYLQSAWKASASDIERNEIGKLADEVRKASGRKAVNG